MPVPLRSGPAALAGPADHLPPAEDVTGNKAKRGREVPTPADLASSLADLVSMRPRDRQLPIFDISWQWVSTRAGSPPRCCSGSWDTGPWPRRSDTWSWPAATTPGWSGCSNRIRVGMLARHLFTALLAGMAVVALAMAFRLGKGLLGIYSILRSAGEEVVITFMTVLFLGLLVLGMIAVILVAVRLRPGRRDD